MDRSGPKNDAKPIFHFLIWWVIWPKTASGHFWKNGPQNGQLFLKKWIPYGSPDQTDKLKTFVGGFSSYDLGIENGRSGCKFTINRAVFDGKPIFDLEASWVCLRGILWIQASHQYLGAPSGFFSVPEIDFLNSLDHIFYILYFIFCISYFIFISHMLHLTFFIPSIAYIQFRTCTV